MATLKTSLERKNTLTHKDCPMDQAPPKTPPDLGAPSHQDPSQKEDPSGPEAQEAQKLRQHSSQPYRWAPNLARFQLEKTWEGSFVPDVPLESLGPFEQETQGVTQLHSIEMSQPLCGDHLIFYARPHEGGVRFEAWFGGHFCSLCKVSGSVMMECFGLLGWDWDRCQKLVTSVLKSLDVKTTSTRESAPVTSDLEGSPVGSDLALIWALTRYATRLGCLRLPWHGAADFLLPHSSPGYPKTKTPLAGLGRGPKIWFRPEGLALLPAMPLRTRIAPSPTGHLHLGHGVHLCFVVGIAHLCRQAEILYRIEDHDQTRCRAPYTQSILDDLRWFLGESVPPLDSRVQVQSQRLPRYQEVLQDLVDRGLVYACRCSRKTLRQAQIFRENSPEDAAFEDIPYPGTCRDLKLSFDTPGTCLRLRLPAGPVFFQDLRHGPLVQLPSHQCGDLVIRDRAGHFTYQFAVSVDDRDQGINLIVRGDDLLPSVGRQLMVRRLIGDQTSVWTYHHPLLMDPQTGSKLSKRERSDSWESLRKCGMSADDFRGECLFRLGVIPQKVPLTWSDLYSLLAPGGTDHSV